MDKYADLRYDLSMNGRFPFDAGIEKRIMDAVPALLAERDALRAALKKCAAVCAGETSNKQGLINALEAAKAALTP